MSSDKNNLPRILCLHGGGSSASIFRAQMRVIIRKHTDSFRYVFVNGPWISEKHSILEPVYPNVNPCYRWARWLEDQPPLHDETAAEEIERVIVNGMAKDEGTGKWISILGFSQGARIAFSILLENQLRGEGEWNVGGFAGVDWKFAVLIAGRGPPFFLSGRSRGMRGFASFTMLATAEKNEAAENVEDICGTYQGNRLYLPTIHVHGLRDEGLEMHRELLERYTVKQYASLIEWDGDHRLPIRSWDVRRVAGAIQEFAKII
jgi:pimeloyl-ACP methyl ester carboxylesterase